MVYKLKYNEIRYLMSLIKCQNLYEVSNRKIHFWERKKVKANKSLTKKKLLNIDIIDQELNNLLVLWLLPKRIIRNSKVSKDCNSYLLLNDEKVLFIEKFYDNYRLNYVDIDQINKFILKIYKIKNKNYEYKYNFNIGNNDLEIIINAIKEKKESVINDFFNSYDDLNKEKINKLRIIKNKKAEFINIEYPLEKAKAKCKIVKYKKDLYLYKNKQSSTNRTISFICGSIEDIFAELRR